MFTPNVQKKAKKNVLKNSICTNVYKKGIQ